MCSPLSWGSGFSSHSKVARASVGEDAPYGFGEAGDEGVEWEADVDVEANMEEAAAGAMVDDGALVDMVLAVRLRDGGEVVRYLDAA